MFYKPEMKWIVWRLMPGQSNSSKTLPRHSISVFPEVPWQCEKKFADELVKCYPSIQECTKAEVKKLEKDSRPPKKTKKNKE